MEIYLSRDNQTLGPFSEEEVREKLKTGDASLDTPAWVENETDWRPLRTFPGFGPPPPPQPSASGQGYEKSIRLTCTHGPDEGKSLELSQQRISLGSSEDCGLLSDDPSVPDKLLEIWAEGVFLHFKLLDPSKKIFSAGAALPLEGKLPSDSDLRIGKSTWRVLSLANQTGPSKFFKAFGKGMSAVTGVKSSEKFDLKAMFQEVFRKHTDEEAEAYLAVGTRTTTPPITLVSASAPKPWLFWRIMLLLFLSSLGLWIMWVHFENPYALPGLMVLGTTVVPFAVLIFFYELNLPRNVSFYLVLKLFIFGGVISLIVTLLIWPGIESALTYVTGMNWGASIAGFTEEPAKAAVLLLVAYNCRYPYILNGMLFGAAIGAGFSVFESAGYVHHFAEKTAGGQLTPEGVLEMLKIRGLGGFASHAVWSAIIGGALWRVKGAGPLLPQNLIDFRFLRIAAIPVVLHAFGNSTFARKELGIYWEGIAFLVGWSVVFILLSEGLNQVRAVQRKLKI